MTLLKRQKAAFAYLEEARDTHLASVHDSSNLTRARTHAHIVPFCRTPRNATTGTASLPRLRAPSRHHPARFARFNVSLPPRVQVRKHMSRLPALDPNTRTLLVCGFPNVGKSSFMNKVRSERLPSRHRTRVGTPAYTRS